MNVTCLLIFFNSFVNPYKNSNTSIYAGRIEGLNNIIRMKQKTLYSLFYSMFTIVSQLHFCFHIIVKLGTHLG